MSVTYKFYKQDVYISGVSTMIYSIHVSSHICIFQVFVKVICLCFPLCLVNYV